MRKLYTLVFIIILFNSCMETKQKNEYNPGDDWKMIWSDEFSQKTLDETKWNRQVEPAGRFNEEWQRYTK